MVLFLFFTTDITKTMLSTDNSLKLIEILFYSSSLLSLK